MQEHTARSHIFPACQQVMGESLWTAAVDALSSPQLDGFPVFLQEFVREHAPHIQYLPDLARLELSIARVQKCTTPSREDKDMAIHPCLELLELEWKHLCTLIQGNKSCKCMEPCPGREKILIWPGENGQALYRPASHNDLLALKLVVEEISVAEAARQTGYPASRIWPIMTQAVREGILIRGQSRIRRNSEIFGTQVQWAEKYLAADVFTLQWHVTQACDLKCRHCYGRESRRPLDLDRALHVLDVFDHFCRQKNVHGQISFTGGNPMLYPQLARVHQEATDRGFTVGILGNPTSGDQLQELQHKGPVSFYQLSLEGLQDHNDYIRGDGHFQSVLDFLDILRKLGIFSMVMLTLTKANTRQVLDLADLLQGRADLFTFNRLSTVGAGALLAPADKKEFKELLFTYQERARDLPGAEFKDNLLNLVRHEQQVPLFGGCTGYGCGAAFNFVAVLSDGQVHACRKFPSPLGNIFAHSLEEIYDSELAQRYRSGPEECRGCPIRPVCGGCLAVIHSSGLNVFQDRDPYCFR